MAPMVAVNDGGDLDFYHVGGVLRLHVFGVPMETRRIRVTFTGMTYVTGTFTVSNAGTASAKTTVSSGSHNYVEFTKSTDFRPFIYLNIPLPTGDYTAITGITVSFYTGTSSLISDDSTFMVPWLSIGRGRGKKEELWATLDKGDFEDLSLIDPFTRSSVSRETANCYVVTEPGYYKIPLYYGNSIVGGADNISTAAPSKVNANDGVFVNAYDVAISSGNIKTDIENAGYTLNTTGGKIIWSTESTTNMALLDVFPALFQATDIAYICFGVPSDGFQEGSALIGVLKDDSTDEYVWAWHIWITNGNILETEEYTNYQGYRIDFLNRPLGSRDGTSLVNTYYQFGMPFPLPPSNGAYGVSSANATLYDENGAYTFNYDSGNTITTLGKALSKPYLPTWSRKFYNNASGANQFFKNMWDATATTTEDKAVVKTIYDPSPAGMSVPRRNAYTGFTKSGEEVSTNVTTNGNIVGSYSQGWKFKKNSSDATGSFWGASTYRYSDNTMPGFGGQYGSYYTATVYNSEYSYFLSFGPSYIRPTSSSNSYRYTAMSVRPALIEN